MSSSPAKFPLLQLPTVPLIQILRSLDAFDIVKLSFHSQEMKRIVRSANYPIETVDFYAQETSCSMEEGYTIMEVNYADNVEVLDDQPKEKQVLKVSDGLEITCGSESFDDKTVNFVCPAGADRKVARDFTLRHFLNVFRKIDKINVKYDSGNLKELDLWNYTKSLGWLFFAENNLEEISAEVMKFALEEVEADYLQICRPVQDGFRFSTEFKAEDVVIGANSSWVDLDAVINSISSRICLMWHEVAITKCQINNLLKLWISGERMTNLTCFIVSNCRIIGEGEDVFDGIEIQHYEDEDTCIVARYNGQLARIAIRDDEFSFFYI